MFAAARVSNLIKFKEIEGNLRSMEDNKQYVITTANHAVLIFKTGNNYSLHDANSSHGWLKLPSVDALFQEIKTSLGLDLNADVVYTAIANDINNPKKVKGEFFCNLVIALQRKFEQQDKRVLEM